jgi:three-Cys-motif partner protein
VAKKRQRDVPDSADEKWEFAAHTEAKHEILRRYLGAWLSILGRGRGGRQPDQLILLDGFAGRGRYMQGQPGSPAVMFERAVQVADDGLAKKVLIRCSEPDATNFGHLQEVSEALTHPKVRVAPSQETFEEVAGKFLDYARKPGNPAPTFVMVDPYGVKGVKLETLKQMLSFDRVEILLTFMVRDPSRFLKEGNYASPLTALFGGAAWKDCENAADRPECLMRRFHDVVAPDVAKYALPFTVFEDEKKTILIRVGRPHLEAVGAAGQEGIVVDELADQLSLAVTAEIVGTVGGGVEEDLEGRQALLPVDHEETLRRTRRVVLLLDDDRTEEMRWRG